MQYHGKILIHLFTQSSLITPWYTFIRRRTDGKLPIHLVKSYELLVFICEKYADGVKIKDQYGRLPIHYVIQNSQVRH